MAGLFDYIPADTGTLVINPNVTNMLYVIVELNCVSTWNTFDETKKREKETINFNFH